MSNLTKDPVSLEDLKRAIAAVPANYADAPADFGGYSYQRLRAEAWRTAFEWRNSLRDPNRNCECRGCKVECAEMDEGMRLIREKLT